MGNFGAKVAPGTDDAPEEYTKKYAEGLGHLQLPKMEKKPCCNICCKVLYVVLAIVTIFISIAVIAVTVATAIAIKIYSTDMSGRIVAMIILAVTAGVTLSMGIVSVIAVFRKKTRSLHTATVVLFILAIIQSIIAGVSVRVTPEDEIELGKSLSDSFKLAREDNPRHVKIWSTTQHDLTCCGVYSAEDYRVARLPSYFSPDVPISCCPGYDPDRSDLVQEREREFCKAKRQFYDVGCKSLVLEVFRDTAALMLGVTVTLIVLEVTLSILGCCLNKENKSKKKGAELEQGDSTDTNKNDTRAAVK